MLVTITTYAIVSQTLMGIPHACQEIALLSLPLHGHHRTLSMILVGHREYLLPSEEHVVVMAMNWDC